MAHKVSEEVVKPSMMLINGLDEKARGDPLGQDDGHGVVEGTLPEDEGEQVGLHVHFIENGEDGH